MDSNNGSGVKVSDYSFQDPTPTTNGSKEPTVNEYPHTEEAKLRYALKQKRLDLVYNMVASRTRALERLAERRRDIDAECDYPKSPAISFYQELYDREPIPARVVEVMCKEAWQVSPSVYETDDAEVTTPFEEDLRDVARNLRGKSWFADETGNPLWEVLLKANIASGIGRWGIIVLGVDDGKPFSEPLGGVDDPSNYTQELISTADPYSATWGLGLFPPALGSSSGYPNPGDSYPYSLTSPSNPPNSTPNGSGGTKPLDSSSFPQEASSVGLAPKRKLICLRVFKQANVEITRYDSREGSSRRGHPLEYLVNVTSPNGETGEIAQTIKVHWTRVVHIADNTLDSEWSGTPRMQPVLNRLLDLRKLYAGSAEMYWQGALPGWAFETHPQLGGDVEIAQQEVREMMEDFSNGFQRWLTLEGMTAKSLAPQVVDPSPQIMVQLEAVCIRIGIPKRIFMGSERGELASGQDDDDWNDRVAHYENFYLSPRLIAPLVDRFIQCGVVRPPKDTYKIWWPNLTSKSELEQADIALKKTQALAAFVSANGESALPLFYFLTRFLDFDEGEATTIIEEATQLNEEKEAIEAEKALEQQQQSLDTQLQLTEAQTKAKVEAAAQLGGAVVGDSNGIKGGDNTPNKQSRPITNQEIDRIAETTAMDEGTRELFRAFCIRYGVVGSN